MRYEYPNKSNSILKYNQLQTIEELVKRYFSAIRRLGSKPTIIINSNRTIVYVFYYIPKWDKRLNVNTVNGLGELIGLILNRKVELRIVKLNYPYLNRHILAQWIVKNLHYHKFVHVAKQIFLSAKPIKNTGLTKSNFSYLRGIKIRLSGRLITERSRPRYTVQTIEVGTFSKRNDSILDISQCTSKNKKGAFNVKVWINSRIGTN
jgi:hypothetical protein